MRRYSFCSSAILSCNAGCQVVVSYRFEMTMENIDSEGWPIIEGVAEFWASRVEFEEKSGLYIINNVLPPDESAGVQNNSGLLLTKGILTYLVYTNAIAAESL